MKGAKLRPKSAAKKKTPIPFSLKKLFASNIDPQTTKKSRPKLIFPDLSFISDVQSPKAILRSFSNLGSSSPNNFASSTKHSVIENRQTPISPEMFSTFTLKSPSPGPKTPIPRSPTIRSPKVSMRMKEKSKLDEQVYLALKEKTQVYYTSPNNMTNESERNILVEDGSLVMDKLGQTMTSSQIEGQKSASQTIIVPIKHDKVKETGNKMDGYVMPPKKRQVKDQLLRKILSESNMSMIKAKDSMLLGAKENRSAVKPVKIVKLRRSETKTLKATTLNNSKKSMERSESPKDKEVSLVDQTSEKLYRSIRLKYLIDPSAEEETSNNLPSKLRSIICESIIKEDANMRSMSESSLFKGQKFTGRFTKIDNAFAKDREAESSTRTGNKNSQRTKRDSERNNNIERISGRCIQKEKRVTELVEELRLANSLMLKETITLDRSRISKSSIKSRKNIGDIINIFPAFSRINN